MDQKAEIKRNRKCKTDKRTTTLRRHAMRILIASESEHIYSDDELAIIFGMSVNGIKYMRQSLCIPARRGVCKLREIDERADFYQEHCDED